MKLKNQPSKPRQNETSIPDWKEGTAEVRVQMWQELDKRLQGTTQLTTQGPCSAGSTT